MNKILITGAGGFVGSHLIRELQSQGERGVYGAVYQATSDVSELLSSDHLISGDLTDPAFAQHLIKTVTPDLIYHLASLSVVEGSIERAGKVLTDNLLLQYNLLESVRLHAQSARVVAVCSANEYGAVLPGEVPIDEETPLRPLNPYAVSKVAQDMLAYQYFLSFGLDIVRLRPFNHTGVGQTTEFVIPALAKQFADIKSGKQKAVIEIGNTETIRDFTAVQDMVKAYVLASAKCVSGEVYNIGSGEGVTVRQIIKELQSIAGIEVQINTAPGKARVSDVPILIANAAKFSSLTLWRPTHSLRQTLESVYNHYKEKN